MQQARADNATTIVTIFVNPRQFNEAADFQQLPAERGARPRDLRGGGHRPRVRPRGRGGLSRPASTRPCRSGRSPTRSRARPGPAISTVSPRSSPSCSTSIGADRAYFGQKDAQQVLVIPRWPRDLAIPTRSSPARPSASPTGSRCRRGTSTSRPTSAPPPRSSIGPSLPRAAAGRPGERGRAALRARCADGLTTEPFATPAYVSVADGQTLEELDRLADGAARAPVAGGPARATRLIDNEPLG